MFKCSDILQILKVFKQTSFERRTVRMSVSPKVYMAQELYRRFCRPVSIIGKYSLMSCIIFLFNFRRYFTMQNPQTHHLSTAHYVHASLLHMGVVRWNKSSLRLERALEYVIEHDSIPNQPVKCMYADLAKAQKCSWMVIERSLRYAVNTLWYSNQAVCSMLLYRTRELLPCPCVSEFLSVYVSAFQRGVIEEWVDSYEEHIFFERPSKMLEPMI